MHIRSLILGVILGITGATLAVPATIVVADMLSPPAYGPVR
jgi:hypothetical protein